MEWLARLVLPVSAGFEAAEALNAELARKPGPNPSTIRLVSGASNAALAGAVLNAARSAEADLAHWRRSTGSAVFLRAGARLVRADPSASQLADLRAFVSCLYAYVGTLKLVSRQPFVGREACAGVGDCDADDDMFFDGELPVGGAAVEGNTDALRTVAICARINAHFAVVIAAAAQQPDKPLPSVTAEINAILSALRIPSPNALPSFVLSSSTLPTGFQHPQKPQQPQHQKRQQQRTPQDPSDEDDVNVDPLTAAASAFGRFYVQNSTAANSVTQQQLSQLQQQTPSEVIRVLMSQIGSIDSPNDVTGTIIRVMGRVGCYRPGHVERNSLFYATACVATIALTQRLKAKSSTLGGSGALEQAIHDTKTSIAYFVASHVTEPLTGIYEQVLANVSVPTAAGSAGHTSDRDLRESQASLQRMVENFSMDHPGLRGAGSMDAVLSAFEAQVRRPIRTALSGDLVETLLIITAKMKNDVEEILVATSRQLTAQRINLHILAAVPAVLAAMGLVYGAAAAIRASRQRGAAAVSHGSATARYCVGDARDVLIRIGACDSGSLRERALVGRLISLLGDVHALVKAHVIHVGRETRWRLRRDLLRLEDCRVPVSTRIALIDRMFLVYADALQSR
jgi:hypothetical protein